MYWLRPPHICIGEIIWTLIEWKCLLSLKANSFSAGSLIAIRVQSIVSLTFVKPAIAENCLLSVTVESNIQHIFFKILCSISSSCKKKATMPSVHLHNGMYAIMSSLLFLNPNAFYGGVLCVLLSGWPLHSLLSCSSLWASAGSIGVHRSVGSEENIMDVCSTEDWPFCMWFSLIVISVTFLWYKRADKDT